MSEYPKMLFLSLDGKGEIAVDDIKENQLREEGYKTYAELLAEPPKEPEQSVYDSFTVPELQELADGRNIEYLKKDTKPTLIAKLIQADETD